MGDYPYTPHARPGSPDTAFEAAEGMKGIATAREIAALQWLRSRKQNGGTADEVAAALEWDKYSARPRLSTLRAQGKIDDSGERRKGSSGRSQAVWVAFEYLPVPGANTGAPQ